MLERSILTFVLVYFILLLDPVHYSTFLTFLLIAGLYENLYVYNKTYHRYGDESAYCILYSSLSIFLITIINTLNQTIIQQLYIILYYNSISDILQWISGKIAGFTALSETTNKTAEEYFFGLLFTSYVANYFLQESHLPFTNFFDNKWVIINLLGMFGVYLSSFVKTQSRIKRWSKILLSNGGINDRLDSWLLPSICYIFYNSLYLSYYNRLPYTLSLSLKV